MPRIQSLKPSRRSVVIAGLGAACLMPLISFDAAKAEVITSGQTLTSGFAAPSLPTGTVVASETEPFSGTLGSATISGSLFSEVLNVGSPTSPQYDFIYQVTNTGTAGDDSIARLSLSSFTGFTTDVSDSTVSIQGSLTSSVTASDIADTGGSVIAFDFNDTPGQIPLGHTTDTLIVATDATTWTQGNGSLTDDAIANTEVVVPVYGILMSNVPEPGTIGLMAVAGGFLLSRRRSK